jgi:hypothetical protein
VVESTGSVECTPLLGAPSPQWHFWVRNTSVDLNAIATQLGDGRSLIFNIDWHDTSG